jgi:hypothetical protein
MVLVTIESFFIDSWMRDEFDGPWFKTDRVRIPFLDAPYPFYPYLSKMLSTDAILVLLGIFYVLVAVALVSADSFFKLQNRPVERFMHTTDSVLRHWPIFLFAGVVMGLVQIGTWAYEVCRRPPPEIRVG